MVNVKISDLPATTALDADDLILVVTGISILNPNSKKVTVGDFLGGIHSLPNVGGNWNIDEDGVGSFLELHATNSIRGFSIQAGNTGQTEIDAFGVLNVGSGAVTIGSPNGTAAFIDTDGSAHFIGVVTFDQFVSTGGVFSVGEFVIDAPSIKGVSDNWFIGDDGAASFAGGNLYIYNSGEIDCQAGATFGDSSLEITVSGNIFANGAIYGASLSISGVGGFADNTIYLGSDGYISLQGPTSFMEIYDGGIYPERWHIDSDGNAELNNINSGTYTPTLTSSNPNVPVVAYACQYHRVATGVTVSGKFKYSDENDGNSTTVSITLPVASDFANDYQCAGTAHSKEQNISAAVFANASTNKANLNFTTLAYGEYYMYFTFTYSIV